MKRFLTLVMTVLLMISGLSGCGCDDGGKIGLVFVNDSDAIIVTVVAEFADRTSGMQNADNSPLKRGDSFSFEEGEYPVTVLVYKKPVGPGAVTEKELARIVISRAPQPGERWYITARDGVGGLVLRTDTHWPEGV